MPASHGRRIIGTIGWFVLTFPLGVGTAMGLYVAIQGGTELLPIAWVFPLFVAFVFLFVAPMAVAVGLLVGVVLAFTQSPLFRLLCAAVIGAAVMAIGALYEIPWSIAPMSVRTRDLYLAHGICGAIAAVFSTLILLRLEAKRAGLDAASQPRRE